MSLEWDPVQRAAWEAGDPDWLNAGTGSPDDTTFTVENGNTSLTWTLENGFVVHIDGQDIRIIIDLETMTVRPA